MLEKIALVALVLIIGGYYTLSQINDWLKLVAKWRAEEEAERQKQSNTIVPGSP